MNNKGTLSTAISQGIASYVSSIQSIHMENTRMIIDYALKDIKAIDAQEAKAIAHLDVAKDYIDKTISSNRGGTTGVHGFIAEYAEVGVQNSMRAVDGLRKIATCLNDNGPADLHVGKSDVQVKFYNNIVSEIEQSEKYRGMKMMFPKEHCEVIDKIMKGERYVNYEGQNLSLSKMEKIRRAVLEESQFRGETYDKWIKPSNLTYDEVQAHNIEKTLDSRRDLVKQQVGEKRQEVNNKAREAVKNELAPSLSEAGEIAIKSAALKGGIDFATYLIKQHRNGKEIWQFTSADWQDAGLETAKGTIDGGIRGLSMYGLQNVCHLAGPSAAAVFEGTKGIALAVCRYRTGEINTDEFNDLLIFNALDQTGAALGAAIGQAVIPIPVFGAVVGSILSSTALNMGKGILNKQEEKLLQQYQNDINTYVLGLDSKYSASYNKMMNAYNALGDLQHYAFDLDLNIKLQLQASVELAEFLGVEETHILHNTSEIDEYFS